MKLFMATVDVSSIKEKIKAAYCGGRALGKGFYLVVVLWCSPWHA